MQKKALIAAIIISIAASIYTFIAFLLPLDVFLWDEAHHGFYAMQIYDDLRSLNMGSFWAHTNNQALWMPLHSWIAGFFLCVFGFSYTAARLSSLFLFLLSSILMYFIGLEMSKERGWIIGIISLLLFITSPIILSMATLNMQEMMGILICLFTLWYILKHISDGSMKKYLIIGSLLSIAYWAKTNYAIQLVFAVTLFQVSLIFDDLPMNIDKMRQWIINNAFIVAGSLPLFILWWITPPFQRKYGLGWAFRAQGLSDPTFSPIAGFFSGSIFYAQSLISSYSFSLWLGLGLLISSFASFRFYSNKKIRITSLMFFANLAFISYISSNNLQERYLSTSAAFAFILLAYFLVMIYDKIQTAKSAVFAFYISGAFLLSMVAYDSLSLTNYTKETANRSIMFFIYKDSLNRYSPPFLFGMAGRPSFTLPGNFQKKCNSFANAPSSSLNGVLDFFISNIDKERSISTMISTAHVSPYTIYWHFHGWKVPVFTLNDMPMTGKYFWFSDYFIDMQVAHSSPYYPDVLDKGWEKVEGFLLKGGYIKLAAIKEFSDLRITAKIFKRVSNINL